MLETASTLRGITVLALCAAVLAPAASSATTGRTPTRAATYLSPTTMSESCRSDAQARAACGVVTSFFRAVNAGRFEAACMLFGERLQSENYGLGCPAFLRAGAPEAVPWGIIRAASVHGRVNVLVTLGQSELDHFRMRRYLAFVGAEGGRLRILDTKLVS